MVAYGGGGYQGRSVVVITQWVCYEYNVDEALDVLCFVTGDFYFGLAWTGVKPEVRRMQSTTQRGPMPCVTHINITPSQSRKWAGSNRT